MSVGRISEVSLLDRDEDKGTVVPIKFTDVWVLVILEGDKEEKVMEAVSKSELTGLELMEE